MSEIDMLKPASIVNLKCPACGSEFDYREFQDSDNKVIKRYEQILEILKLKYGDIKVNNNEVLLTVIKNLECVYSKVYK
jgi:uncharacterized protein (DUF2225 family)